MLLPLDGPSVQDTVSVTTATVVEAKIGASALSERKVVTLQPRTSKLYVYFGAEGVTPNAATVAADGFIVFKNAIQSFEASESQKIFLLSVSVTNTVVIAERA